jgi:hypothetical protein
MPSTTEPTDWGGGPNGQPLLVPGTLRGYRLMTITIYDRSTGVLLLRGGRTDWPALEMTAECLRNRGVIVTSKPIRPSCREAPGDTCQCGIYNSYTPDFEPRDRITFHWIVVTANWGKIILGPYGFRAAHTRILAAAPRTRSLDYVEPDPIGRETAFWIQQQQMLANLGVPISASLADLLVAYPPDDVTGLRPAPAATDEAA